jgi:hypothetical protein
LQERCRFCFAAISARKEQHQCQQHQEQQQQHHHVQQQQQQQFSPGSISKLTC